LKCYILFWKTGKQESNYYTYAILLAFFVTSFHIQADIWDPGLQRASVKTAFISNNEGTAGNPITVLHPFNTNGGCLWDQNHPLLIKVSPTQGCPSGPTVYSQGPHYFDWSQYPTGFTSRRWVLEINLEPSWNNINPNPGPPDLSWQRSEPGNGVMGFKMIKDTPQGENFYRAHLVNNELMNCGGNLPNPNCQLLKQQHPGHVPFMSIGAADNRGNGAVLTKLNDISQKHKIRFVAKLWAYHPFDTHSAQADVASFFMMAMASWGGKKRGLFINLFHDNINFSGFDSEAYNGGHKVWNWPMQESHLYPGADFAYLDAEDMSSLCGIYVPRITSPGQQITYTIDLQDVFQCASNRGLFVTPMPLLSQVPIKKISWGNEWFGTDGAIWTSVHGMRLIW